MKNQNTENLGNMDKPVETSGYSEFISDLREQTDTGKDAREDVADGCMEGDNLFDFLTIEQATTASVRDTLLLLYCGFKSGNPDMETIVPNVLRLAIDTLTDQHERMSCLYMTMSEKFPEEYENSQLLNEEVEEYDDDEEIDRVFIIKDTPASDTGKADPSTLNNDVTSIRDSITAHTERVRENAGKE